MKISTRGRYGLRAMIDLASQSEGSCVKLKDIAERQGISEHYLEQLISVFKKAGFVKSVRGARGGYHLNIEPEEISVGDILRVMEGSLFPVDCISDGDASCGSSNCDACVAKGVWEKIYASLNGVIDSITLQDLVNDYKGDGLIEQTNIFG